MTNGELTSRIITILKANSKDGRISRRLVLKTAESKARFFISQKLNDRSLYREENIYTEISCVELIDQDVVKCPIIEFRRCTNLKRSRCKLPELIHSKYGSSLKEVISIDGDFVFKPTTPAQYRLNKERTLKSKDLFFYVKDGYLYLPDTEVEVVNLYLITLDLYEAEQCSECSDNKCRSAWDLEFICPDKLEEAVIQETLKELSIMKQIQEDANPNMNPNG